MIKYQRREGRENRNGEKFASDFSFKYFDKKVEFEMCEIKD